MVYINPDTCVNCDACVPSCPVEAIYSEESLPSKYQSYVALNAEGAKKYPILNQKQSPLPSAKPLQDLQEEDKKGQSPSGDLL